MCTGPSMQPTLNPRGDYVLVDKLTPSLRRLKVRVVGGDTVRNDNSTSPLWLRIGDVVVAKSPTNPSMTVCKRVVALPGDIVDVCRERWKPLGGEGRGRESQETWQEDVEEKKKKKKKKKGEARSGDKNRRRDEEKDLEREVSEWEEEGEESANGQYDGESMEQDCCAVCRFVVPEGRVWLRGDNARNSTDSRRYGAIPISLVEGRVLARVWPLRQAGRLATRPLPPSPTDDVGA